MPPLPCHSRASIQGTNTTRRALGARLIRGFVAALLPIGIGAAVERVALPQVVDIDVRGELLEGKNEVLFAKDLLEKAGQQLARSDYNSAIDSYTLILRAVPDQYTPCMKALLGRRDAYFALGRRGEGARDNRQEFLWGRGIRWPGWYIIAVILLRNELVRSVK